MLAVRTTGPCLELPVVDRGLGVLSTRAITVMLDAANARFDESESESEYLDPRMSREPRASRVFTNTHPVPPHQHPNIHGPHAQPDTHAHRFDENLRRLLALQRAFEAFAAAPGAGGDATLDDADT